MTTASAMLARLDPAAPGPAAGGLPDSRAGAPAPTHGKWPLYLGVWGGLLAAIFALLHADVAHLVTRWWNSSTYGHCLLIPPILVWLVWQRRDGLAKLAPQPWLPGALGLLGAGAIWLVGHFAGVALLRHAALVFMFIASVPTVFGLAVARGVTFPLAFALFMIPVGEQLEPWLQTITAEMATWMLTALGVPTHMDGVFISIPNGDFEVAQACSGVRFLIAMVCFGALVANVCFLSWRRRIAFLAASFLLPILANGVRVWGTIHAAHLTTPEVARGIDHVVYGWVFFAAVMALLLAVGWRFFDRPVDDPFIDPAKLQAPGAAPAPTSRLALAAGVGFAAAAAFPAYASFADAQGPERPTRALSIPAPPGWRPVPYSGQAWRPEWFNATAEQFVSFDGPAGKPVDVFIAVYDQQREGQEIVGWKQGVIEYEEDHGWSWAGDAPPLPGGRVFQINYGPVVRDVAQFYWVNGRLTGSQAQAKIETLKARVLGGEPQAAVVIVSAQRLDNFTSARPAIERFLADAGPLDGLVRRAIVTDPAAAPATGR
jgi:exosortase A